MRSRISGRAGYGHLTTETALKGPKAMSLAWIEAPARPTCVSQGLADVLVAVPPRHNQFNKVFEVVNRSICRGLGRVSPGTKATPPT